MAEYRFERQSRTLSSEQYIIREGDQRVGRVDLHFTQSVVHATLAVEERLTEDEIMDLIDLIDEDLVSSSDVPRDDFVIAVYQGREVGVYSDDFFEGEAGEEEEEE
ncbi:MAG: hypothetical protein HY331_10475 [Chloroflexi bacterium]|nr:hypothetical protein [Chloroflexota bacterium]